MSEVYQRREKKEQSLYRMVLVHVILTFSSLLSLLLHSFPISFVFFSVLFFSLSLFLSLALPFVLASFNTNSSLNGMWWRKEEKKRRKKFQEYRHYNEAKRGKKLYRSRRHYTNICIFFQKIKRRKKNYTEKCLCIHYYPHLCIHPSIHPCIHFTQRTAELHRIKKIAAHQKYEYRNSTATHNSVQRKRSVTQNVEEWMKKGEKL